jgi:uncharacterized protein
MSTLAAPSQSPSPSIAKVSPIASWRHTIGLACVFLGLTAAGAYFQLHDRGHAQGSTSSHVPLYLSLIAIEYGLFRYVKAGIRGHGVSVQNLIGERWNNYREALRDIGLALCFWAVWMGGERLWTHVFPASHAVSINGFLPRKPLEIALWIIVSISAGISEEIAFRGYFQRQFWSLTGNKWAAVCLQGVLFGMGHGYQGAQAMVRIVIIGIAFGALAAWRGSLRAGIMAHALGDILSGLFGI